MTVFFVLATLMTALAAGLVAWPLWRQAVPGAEAGQPPAAPRRGVALVLSSALVAGVVATYAVVGEPEALSKAGQQPELPRVAEAVSPDSAANPLASEGEDATQARIQGMVDRLAQRLQSQPDDAPGWRMLAKSYETLGRFDLAVQAYQRLMALEAPDAELLTHYAVTLGMSQGQTLAGEPEKVLAQALKLDPNHVQALALSGSAAFEQRDYKRAVAQWEKLLALIPKDAEMRDSIERNVEKAKALGA